MGRHRRLLNGPWPGAAIAAASLAGLPLAELSIDRFVGQLEEALVPGERPKLVYTCPNFEPNWCDFIIRSAAATRVRLQFLPECASAGSSQSSQSCSAWAHEGGSRPLRFLVHDAHDRALLSDEDPWKDNLATLIEVYRSRRDGSVESNDEHLPDEATYNRVPMAASPCGSRFPMGGHTRALLAAAVEGRVAYVPGLPSIPKIVATTRCGLPSAIPHQNASVRASRGSAALLDDERALYLSLQP